MKNFIWATGLDAYDLGLTLNSIRITGDGNAQSYSDKIVTACKNGETILLLSELILDTNNVRTDLLGIEVLKWLRIKHRIGNPIILFGFLKVSHILRQHPEHIIITAPGVHYIPISRIPENFVSVASKLTPVENIKEQYKEFVQADFKIQHFRHQYANEFGCFKLSKVVEQILDVQHFLDRKILENNLNWHKLEMLYTHKRTSDIYVIKEQVKKLRALLKKRKVIYVDDKGDLGWFKIIDSLLYDDTESFKYRKKNYIGNEKINNLMKKGLNEFASYIINSKPIMVFLDLRLKGNEEKNLKIEEISGAKLLRRIKELQPELPVIMLSATNKIHSLEVLTKYPYSASNLWTKPGVEDESSITKSLELLITKIYKTLTYCDKTYAKFILKSEYFKHQQAFKPKATLNKFDYIIFDTNFFCESRNAKQYATYLTCFDAIIENTSLRKKVVLIEDVISELFINSFKKHLDHKTRKDNTELVNGIAKNSIEKILDVLTTNKIENFRVKISHLLNNNIHYKTYRHKRKWAVARCRDVIIDTYNNKDTAITQKKRLDDEEKYIKSLVYADNVFKYLIKSLSRNSSILFVSDDIRCKKDISLLFYGFQPSKCFVISKEGAILQHKRSVFLDKLPTSEIYKKIKGVQLVKNNFFSSHFFD